MSYAVSGPNHQAHPASALLGRPIMYPVALRSLAANAFPSNRWVVVHHHSHCISRGLVFPGWPWPHPSPLMPRADAQPRTSHTQHIWITYARTRTGIITHSTCQGVQHTLLMDLFSGRDNEILSPKFTQVERRIMDCTIHAIEKIFLPPPSGKPGL